MSGVPSWQDGQVVSSITPHVGRLLRIDRNNERRAEEGGVRLVSTDRVYVGEVCEPYSLTILFFLNKTSL